MAKVIKMDLDEKSIDKAIKELERYKKQLDRKCKTLAKRLADYGLTKATIKYATALYVGPQDWKVTVKRTEHGYAVQASGKTVLLLEFGAGITFGDGHPLNGEFGMGPGTYPDGKGHWNDPKGWYLPKSAGGGHTYGNPPSMAMYNTAEELRGEIEKIAREVFASNA